MRRSVPSLLFAAALALAQPGLAAPFDLSSDGLDRMSGLMERYHGANRLGWVIEAPSEAEGRRAVRGLELRLGPSRRHLAERVDVVVTSGEPRAYAKGRPGKEDDCSWRVTLTDPAIPAPDGTAVSFLMENGDRLPVSASATFEIGFSGPLQSTLYAFGETKPGAVRDLAAAPELVISVVPEEPETLILIRARRPVPFLDQVAGALAPKPGARGDLGQDFALAKRFMGASRGIGALIQLVDPAMVVAEGPKIEAPVPAPKPLPAEVTKSDLLETCLYTVTPLEGS